MTGLRFFKGLFSFPGFYNWTSVPIPASSNWCCSKHSLRTDCMILCNYSGAYLISSAVVLSGPSGTIVAQLLSLQTAFVLKRWACWDVFCILWMGIVLESCYRRNDSGSIISLLHICLVCLTKVYFLCHGHIGSLISVYSTSWLFWTFYCYYVCFLQLSFAMLWLFLFSPWLHEEFCFFLFPVSSPLQLLLIYSLSFFCLLDNCSIS